MTRLLCGPALLTVVLAFPPQLFGHHSFDSEFDRSKPVMITGTVTKVEWTNPHGRFFVDVKEPSGTIVQWEFETGSVNALMRNGWTRTTMKAGDTVTVAGFLARDTPRLASASVAPGSITLADGRKYLPGTVLPPSPSGND